MMARIYAVALCVVVTGCMGEIETAEDTQEPEGRCEDPKYGNGVCDLDTSCDVVDVDCFVEFTTPEDAKTWYEASGIATLKGPALPTTDARFAPTQAMIDEGWAAYKKLYKVGDLADARVQLVLVENDAVNAFVIADKDGVRAGLAVMVNTKLVDLGAPKEQVLGIMMHEFAHAIGLHVNPTVKERMRAYYKAPAGLEPMGHAQTDDANIRRQFEAWEEYSQVGGVNSDLELSGLPMMHTTISRDTLGAFGIFGVYFAKLVNDRRAVVNTTACNQSVTAFASVHDRILGLRRAIDFGFSLDAGEPQTIVTAVTQLRDNCFAGVTGDAITHIARLASADEASLRASLPAEVLAAIEGKTVITGWFNAIQQARTKMRELEAAFKTQTGEAWDRLRYYSTEEAADDLSAHTMEALSLAADGAGRLLVGVSPALASVCTPMLGSGQSIPYGENLADDHHATCWRAKHMQDVVAATTSGRLASWRPLGPSRASPALFDIVGAEPPLASH